MITTETASPLTNGCVVGNNVNAADYIKQVGRRGERDFVMSRSELCEFNVCPSRWLAGVKSGDTAATEWGSLIDCRVLEPEKFDTRYILAPATYPFTPKKKGAVTIQKPWTRKAAYCQDWESAQLPKITITRDEEYESSLAVKRLLENDEISELIQCSHKQVLVGAEYRDEATGIVVPIKCLLDLVPDCDGRFRKSLADFKTSRDAEPHEWAKLMFKHDYHIQAAMYLDAFVSATGEDRVEFRHIIQENFPPYQPARRIVSLEFLEIGRATYKAALARYCQCLDSGIWPDYDDHSREQINGWQITQPEAWMVKI